jgi:uncharacterized protein (UPF0128 family)
MLNPKFKKGDFVICTDDRGRSTLLTKGKEYEVLDVSKDITGDLLIKIVCDNGLPNKYMVERFKISRKSRLKDLLKEI